MPIIVPTSQLIWDSTTFVSLQQEMKMMPLLVDSIIKHGFMDITTIIVQKQGNHYLLIKGRHISRALVMLGYKEIPVSLMKEDEDIHLMRKVIVD